MGQKFYIKTLGCQMNEYDSAKMADLLSTKHGMTPINAPSEADMIVLNTCSVMKILLVVYSSWSLIAPLKSEKKRCS